ncbi:MAG: hypothetical protein ACK4OH_12575 [Acidovorax temperans]
MTIRAYQWLGVALFSLMVGLLLLISSRFILFDFDAFKGGAWGISIGYLIGWIFVIHRERKLAKEDQKNSGNNIKFNSVVSEISSFPTPPSSQKLRNYALPTAVFLGLLSITLVLGYHHKLERDRSACYELMSAARATFNGRASEVISLFLGRSLKPEWEELVLQIENTYNLTFSGCRKVIGK